jgi:hypothetical protein
MTAGAGYTSKSIAAGFYDFSGIYDGQGYTITIGNVVPEYTGLFDTLASPTLPAVGGIVRNTNVTYNSNISLSPNTIWGGLVGGMPVCSIINCSVTYNGTITLTTSSPSTTIGLVCGFMGQGSSISNTNLIINNGISITGGDNNIIGLFCGYSSSSYISGSSITTSTGTFNISLTVTDSGGPSGYSAIGLITGTSDTSITSVSSPLLLNNTVNLNNSGTIILNNPNGGLTYKGAISGTLDGDSDLGTSEAVNCTININNNQTLTGGFDDFFGNKTDNPTIQGCQFNYTTKYGNSSKTITISPAPPTNTPLIYTNSYNGSYNLGSGNYYIPNTTGSVIIGPQTISLQSQISPAGIIISGLLYIVGTSVSSANSLYSYIISVKGVGSMYFGLELTSISQDIIDTPEECICQINSCSTNPQTGITADSRITNTREDKTIRVNVDREFSTNSVIAPKFKSYSDYMKYLQGALKY